MDTLAPIDEEPSEAGDLARSLNAADDDEQPITMIPRIMHTAPSPTAETALTTIGGKAAAAPATSTPRNGAKNGEISQIESVL